MGDEPLPSVATQARARRTRARLLAAAMESFAENGVDGARVEDIVSAAQASWGSFFRYFPRKTDVLLAEAARRLAAAAEAIRTREAADPDGPVRPLVLAAFRSLLPGDHPPALNAAVVRQMHAEPDRLAAMLADAPPLQELLVGLVTRGQETGELRDDLAPPLLAGILAISVLTCTSLFQARPESRPEHADQTLRVVFSAAWDGLGARR